MREFVTAVEKAEEELHGEEPVEFKVDGVLLHAYRPTEGQFALLMMAMGRHASNTDQFAGVVDFFFNVLDEPSQRYMMARLTDRENLITVTQIVEIMEWLIEEWGGRPTQSPSASTSSRRSGGRKSTATMQPST